MRVECATGSRTSSACEGPLRIAAHRLETDPPRPSALIVPLRSPFTAVGDPLSGSSPRPVFVREPPLASGRLRAVSSSIAGNPSPSRAREGRRPTAVVERRDDCRHRSRRDIGDGDCAFHQASRHRDGRASLLDRGVGHLDLRQHDCGHRSDRADVVAAGRRRYAAAAGRVRRAAAIRWARRESGVDHRGQPGRDLRARQRAAWRRSGDRLLVVGQRVASRWRPSRPARAVRRCAPGSAGGIPRAGCLEGALRPGGAPWGAGGRRRSCRATAADPVARSRWTRWPWRGSRGARSQPCRRGRSRAGALDPEVPSPLRSGSA